MITEFRTLTIQTDTNEAAVLAGRVSASPNQIKIFSSCYVLESNPVRLMPLK